MSGSGKVLVPDEPAASVVKEALEGFASGRFETQADVMRFLQNNLLFPKDSRGIVRHQRVAVLLNQHVYAGYVAAPKWGVSLRKGQHEALIRFEIDPGHLWRARCWLLSDKIARVEISREGDGARNRRTAFEID